MFSFVENFLSKTLILKKVREKVKKVLKNGRGSKERVRKEDVESLFGKKDTLVGNYFKFV